VLGQKIPRFDNRIIEKCALMPRFNVCKVRSDEQKAHGERGILPQEVTFLMKLKNMRVQRNPKLQNGLTAEEITHVFNAYADKGWKLTETQWRKFCASLGATPVPPSLEVEAPKLGGRSRLCRPALEILKRLILSGQKPQDFHAAELQRLNGNTDPRKGLVATDLKFLLDMGNTWEGIYIPNQKLDALAQRTQDSEAAILELVGSQNDPIVRHRLGAFWKRLHELESEHGKPDEIVIEFIREEFMGEKALLDYRKFIKDREKERKQAKADAEAAGSNERSAGLKMELLRLQAGICLYQGTPLVETSLDEYEVDHIVPRSQGGPDAMVNYILTTKTTNDEKGNRTPFEWLSATAGWDAYVNRVKGRQTALRNKKVRLLLLPDAAELADKYTALAETAWIAKLAQTLAGLQFGWKNGNDDQGRKRVTIISGGLTARIRRKYKLNSLLVDDGTSEEDAEKNRADDRHHALDAMVLAFIPGWARDVSKQRWFRFPTPVDANPRGFFAGVIAKVQPRNVHLAAARLEATAYGKRFLKRETDIKNAAYAVGRETLLSLLLKVTNGKESLKPADKADTKRIVDPMIRHEVESHLRSNPSISLDQWKTWCSSYRIKGTGPKVVKVLMTKTKADSTDEYVDVSKDGTSQLRRGETHQGYFVYWTPTPTKKEPDKRRAVVKPVYAFQPPSLIQRELRSLGIHDAQFFKSGCTVELSAPVAHSKTPLLPGKYVLNSIWTDGRAKVTSVTGKLSDPINLGDLLNAGFKRSN
jgi:CRISPR-associated endonuclease Csn1